MTRKDYVLLARAFGNARPHPTDSKTFIVQWEIDVEQIADALAADNPRFDRDRFLAACNKGE